VEEVGIEFSGVFDAVPGAGGINIFRMTVVYEE